MNPEKLLQPPSWVRLWGEVRLVAVVIPERLVTSCAGLRGAVRLTAAQRRRNRGSASVGRTYQYIALGI